jgi:hypothetical protein
MVHCVQYFPLQLLLFLVSYAIVIEKKLGRPFDATYS